MALRYKKIDWYWLRSITETSLNEYGKFPVPVNIDGKMEKIESGLYHDNYRFRIRGIGLPKEWKEKPLLLRLSSQSDPLRSKSEAGNYLIREAKTLQVLKRNEFRFETPELICMLKKDAEDPVGLIETWVWGISLPFYKDSIHADRIIPTIAEVAAAVHQLPSGHYGHLEAFTDSRLHVLKELGNISPELFSQYPIARTTTEWILSCLPENRPATVLHGDLLPQNIICGEDRNQWKVAVIDWEFAEIGDPACDLAIVTRGDRKILGINNGLALLVEAYREAGGIELYVSDVRIHELLFFLKWLQDSDERIRNGKTSGHGPDYYTQRLESLLRRAEK